MRWQFAVAMLLCFGSARIARAQEAPGPSAELSRSPPYRCVTNYYVDASAGSDANPGTKDRPWKTIANADNGYPNVPKAGECVNVLPGEYPISKGMVFGAKGSSNSPEGYVVYRSTVPQAAHVIAATGLTDASMIALWGSYIVIDGFEIDGNHSATSGSGIDGCTGGGGDMNIAHHIVAINNVIHDVGGAGLSACTAEYITWEHNIIYNTSATNRYQVSGISLWKPKSLDKGSFTPAPADDTEFHVTIAYNVVHDNSEGPSIPGEHTDGNGIIIDTTFGSSDCPSCGTPYPGKILVLGNVSYRNGGGGIHVFLSRDVTIANNTVYNNYLDPLNRGKPRGELSNIGSENISWINNIAIAVPGAGVLGNAQPMVSFGVGSFKVSGIWLKNIGFGAPVTSDPRSYVDPKTNLLGIDPMLTDLAHGNFVPLHGSPAIGSGQPERFLPSSTPNIGAY